MKKCFPVPAILACTIALLIINPVFAQNLRTLEGTIRAAEGKPVAGATLHLLNTNRYVIGAADGSFKFESLLPGAYQLECSAAGFATQIQHIDLSEKDLRLSVTLQLNFRQLDAVLVTAEKRETVSQQSPLAISTLSAKKAEQFRIWNSRDLSALAPNLYSTHSGDDRNVTSIRGIATTSYTPSVTTYIDGISQFSLDTYIATLFDIERIEILRGPQGTLYGRNALGGVINILTKQPTNTTKGYVEWNTGNNGIQRYNGAVRFPLVKDKLYMGVAAQYFQRGGFYTNTYDNKGFDRLKSLSGNYYLKFHPSRSWSFSLNVKHQHTRNNGAFPLVNGVQDAFEKPYELTQNARGLMSDNTMNASLIAQHDGPNLQFTAQSGYQVNYRYYKNPLDGDFSPLDAVTISNNYGKDWNRVKVFTQEIRLSNPAAKKSPLNWTLGAYLFHQYNPVKQATNFGADAGLLGVPDTDFSLINTSKEKANGQALFGQLTYQLSKKVFVTSGLRADREKKQLNIRGDYEKAGVGSFETRSDTSASDVFYSLSPKLGLRYQTSENSQLYASWSKGFRAGGFTPLSSDPSQPPLYAYKPEYSDSWELGSKNTFWDNRVIMNLTLFYTVIRDLQVPTLILPDAITIIRNTGKMVSKGVELEGTLVPVKRLELDYSFGYTKAQYESLKVSSNGENVDLKGKNQLYTPKQTSLLAAQYAAPLSKRNTLQLQLRAEWIYTGDTYFDLANTIKQEGYGLLNTRVGVVTGKLEWFLWTRNLTGKKYIAYAYDFGAVHLGDPRTYGLSLKAKL